MQRAISRPSDGTPGRVREFVLTWATTVLRLVLAGVFVTAGAQKLPDPAASVRAVRAYRVLPEGAVHVVAYGLPVLEIAVALLLLVGLAVRLSAAVTALLLVVFLAGIASVAARGLSIDCGCFGGGGAVGPGETHYTSELVRDALLLVAALLVARWPASPLSLDSLLATPVRPGPARPGPAPDLDEES